jgi:hypothetical protein
MTPSRPACTSDACGQDSRRCKTPQACHVPDEAPAPDWEWRVIFGCAAIAFVIVLALSASV